MLKETITSIAQAKGRYSPQTGGRPPYGAAHLMVEPLERGQGFAFVNALEGPVLPQAYIQAIEEGVRGSLEHGVLAGHPVVDIRVTLLGGFYHETDSSQMAFKMAGSYACKEAILQARPIVIELDS